MAATFYVGQREFHVYKSARSCHVHACCVFVYTH